MSAELILIIAIVAASADSAYTLCLLKSLYFLKQLKRLVQELTTCCAFIRHCT